MEKTEGQLARELALQSGIFEEVVLTTEGGALVARVVVLKFKPRPQVLLWGQRVFMRDERSDRNKQHGDFQHYFEAFMHAVVPIAGVTDNGLVHPFQHVPPVVEHGEAAHG